MPLVYLIAIKKTGGIYYPFGLIMVAVSSKASEFGKLKNRYIISSSIQPNCLKRRKQANSHSNLSNTFCIYHQKEESIKMNSSEKKRKLLEEFYYPFFKGQGFRKRGNGDVYKDLDNKFVVIVQITEAGGRTLDDFSINIGLKLNRRQPTRMKLRDVNIDNCDVMFNISRLIYKSSTEKVDEYSYDFGCLFGSETMSEIGGKHSTAIFINKFKKCKEFIERERIKEREIKVVVSTFDLSDKFVSRRVLVFYDLSAFIGVSPGDHLCQKFIEDLNLIVVFLKEIVSIESFFDIDSRHIISESFKEHLSIRLSVNRTKRQSGNRKSIRTNKLLAECNRVLLPSEFVNDKGN